MYLLRIVLYVCNLRLFFLFHSHQEVQLKVYFYVLILFQVYILQILHHCEFYDSYEGLGEVRSRINGEEKHIDIELVFKDGMEYQDVRAVATKIKERVREELGDSHINIII